MPWKRASSCQHWRWICLLNHAVVQVNALQFHKTLELSSQSLVLKRLTQTSVHKAPTFGSRRSANHDIKATPTSGSTWSYGKQSQSWGEISLKLPEPVRMYFPPGITQELVFGSDFGNTDLLKFWSWVSQRNSTNPKLKCVCQPILIWYNGPLFNLVSNA